MSERHFFVSDGDNRTETAILLVGTAEEHGVSQDDIFATNGGFLVSEEVADLVRDYADVRDIDVEPADDGHDPDIDPASDPLLDDPASDPLPDEEGFDPSEHSPAEVKAIVTEHPESAREMLAAEQEGKNRPALVLWLTQQANEESTNAQTSGN